MSLTESDVLQTIVTLAKPVVNVEALRKVIDPGQHPTLRIHLGSLFRSGQIMRRNGADVVYWTLATADEATRKGYVAADLANPTALPDTKTTNIQRRISVSKVSRSADVRARLENTAEKRAHAVPLPAVADGKPYGSLYRTAKTGRVAYLLFQLAKLEPGRWYTAQDVEQLLPGGLWLERGEMRRVLDALSMPPKIRSEQPAYLLRREIRFTNREYPRGSIPYCWRWADNHVHPYRKDLADAREELTSDDSRVLWARLAAIPSPTVTTSTSTDVTDSPALSMSNSTMRTALGTLTIVLDGKTHTFETVVTLPARVFSNDEADK